MTVQAGVATPMKALEMTLEAADSDLRAIQQSIERAEKEWNEAVAQKDETLSREKALREA